MDQEQLCPESFHFRTTGGLPRPSLLGPCGWHGYCQASTFSANSCDEHHPQGVEEA